MRARRRAGAERDQAGRRRRREAGGELPGRAPAGEVGEGRRVRRGGREAGASRARRPAGPRPGVRRRAPRPEAERVDARARRARRARWADVGQAARRRSAGRTWSRSVMPGDGRRAKQVQLGGDVPERASGRRRRARGRARPARSALGDRGGHQVGDHPYTVDLLDREPAPRAAAPRRRPRRSGGAACPAAPARPSGSASSAAAASRWPLVARASTAAARPATSTLAAPPGRSAAAIAATTPAGSSTTSSTAWQSTRSTLPGSTRPASASPSPCTARTRSATPASAARRVSAASASGLASTTVTWWPGLGQRHGEPAGAAAHVEDGQAPSAPVQLAAQHRPDDRGARAGACRCSLHPQKPNARFAGTGARISPPCLPCGGFSLERCSNEFTPPEGNTK